MFTGIVETIGVVSTISLPSPQNSSDQYHHDDHGDDDRRSTCATTLTITNAEEILSDCHLGDSISINGTCLTVTWNDSSSFRVGVAPETLRRTNLGSLRPGHQVNLERAVTSHSRMGGHFVQGHIDTVATILQIVPDGNALIFRFRPRDSQLMKYIVEKGYIAIDGASLTVTQVNDSEAWWEVMLIAYTQERIVTATKKPGDQVNVEVDQVGKYVEKMLHAYVLKGPTTESSSNINPSNTILPLEKMLEKTLEKLVDARLEKYNIPRPENL